ncbi:MAG: hypothetical protein JWQ11_27, partial [Rhizobacter sp.]|nr:hypothetical protein [Rhizobacter sp.]
MRHERELKETSMNKALSSDSSDLLDRPDALRRRLLQASALALTAGTALPRAFAQTATRPDKLTLAVIGDGRTGIWASLRSGDDKRLDRELGTRIVWQPGFTASLPVMEALRAGGVDFTFATATAVVNAVAANVPIVPLAAYALPANEVDLLVPKASTVKSAADLRGKTIAHQNGTTGTYSLIKYLESAGLR